MGGADMTDRGEWRAVLRAERRRQDRQEALEIIVAVADDLKRSRNCERCDQLPRGLKVAAALLGDGALSWAAPGDKATKLMRTPQQLRATRAWYMADVGPNPAERRVLEAIERTGGLLIQYRNGRQQAFFGGGCVPIRCRLPCCTTMSHQRYLATGRARIKGGRQ
jgi:hypothetical protein